ncbi:ABC-type proline/glycine betaine transport system, permease component [Clostridium aceticum]|uniref:ABC-type proline/glycine betaine transport system, permease component n=1 Tax=Clostridium aceticum TaxID=84022 RepID=A0A0D8IB71_9CLOT|nr:proline/glycine betaine ABC transporter permease [Clostridium aceticum]AKL96751.1 ABC-type proline/glycine betaine transport system, permease component [Clostridium aceticum]KJF27513.1 choline ABC transporter permease [Clostridium aceticum]
MYEFPEFLKFELGVYVDSFVKWLVNNFDSVFDALGANILRFLTTVDFVLQLLPWWFFILIVFFMGWRIKKLSSGIGFAFMLLIIGSFGLWTLMIETLAVILTSVVISVMIGIPIGILMAYKSNIETAIRPILDGMQTMPSFVYLIPAMLLFGLGRVSAVFATTIYAIVPVIRLTNLGIRNVSKEMVEAAHSFGSSPWQILYKVELPQALPTIMTGINQTIMMAMAMVVIASMIGAPGLGREVLVAINRIDIAKGTEAGLAIVILAIIIDRLTQGVADKFKVEK